MIHNLLRDKEIILASASPRRKEIFEMIGIKTGNLITEDEQLNHYAI